MTNPIKPRFTVKNVKSFNGMEGLGFECSLYLDGKRVGTAFDEGCGGTPHFRVKDDVLKVFTEEAMAYQGEPDLPLTPPYAEMWAREAYIGKLVDDAEELKALKRHCRTKILFMLEGDEEGSWRTLKAKYGTSEGGAALAWLEKKYGEKVSRIANEELAR